MPNYSIAGALELNGSSQYVSVADNSAFSYTTNSGLTICCWMNPASLAQVDNEIGDYIHFISKQASSNYEFAMRMYITGNSEGRNNRISFYHFSLTGGLGTGSYFEDTVIPGEWIHVTGVMDTSYVSIYKNGVFRDRDIWTGGGFPPGGITPGNGTAAVELGRAGNFADTSYLQGKISDIRIFNRVLTQTEIWDIYNRNEDVTSGLVGRWKLDDGSGSTATDSSGNGRNGTVTGSPTWTTGPSIHRWKVTDAIPGTSNLTNAIAARTIVT